MNQSARNIQEMFAELWAAKWVFVVVWVVVAVATFGLTYLITPKWKSQTEFVPEYNLQERRALQDVAWDLNIDAALNSSSTVLWPIVYPGIIADGAFLKQLGEKEVVDSKGVRMTVFAHYSRGLKDAGRVYGRMSKRITGKQIRKENSFLLTVLAEDPAVATQVATLCREQLAEFIERDKDQVRQRNLACYAALAESNQTARMLYEMAEIDAQHHQPVFAVIRNASEPFKKDSPRRLVITFVALVFATLAVMSWAWRKRIPEWL